MLFPLSFAGGEGGAGVRAQQPTLAAFGLITSVGRRRLSPLGHPKPNPVHKKQYHSAYDEESFDWMRIVHKEHEDASAGEEEADAWRDRPCSHRVIERLRIIRIKRGATLGAAMLCQIGQRVVAGLAPHNSILP